MIRSFLGHARHPGTWLKTVTGGAPTYPLIVLFGLNAVDELDRTAFGILVPEIREDFGLDLQGMLTLIAFVSLCALALQVPIAMLADRYNRVRIAWIGAAAWAMFSLGTGLATGVIFLAIMRAGSGVGKAVVDPTHNSLISDYYEPAVRPGVFSAHRAANAVGAFVGPLTAGLLAAAYGWRAPFFVFVVPTLVFVVLAWRLQPPVRGGQERRAMGASEEAIATEEESPSFAEGWRLVWKIETLRRIWYSLPFLAASLIGFVSLASLLYDEVFGLDERARGFVAASTEPIQLVGLVIGARVATKLLAKGPDHVLGFLSKSAFVVSACLVVFALAPNIWVAIAANMVITGTLAIIGPGILACLSLAIPPRARSIGFSVASLWIIPGLIILPIIGGIGDRYGIRQGMLVMVPLFFVGGLMIATTKRSISDDITQVWKASAARSEALLERREGRSKLLLIRDVEVSYGNVQVLFGVDFEVAEGDVVALLGTNGAGKSTLLNAISGVTEADRGAVIFDGRDITHAPPNEIAAMGIAQVPGGKGVFPSLTVDENLELGTWLHHRDGAAEEGLAKVRELFPILVERGDAPAGDLSGGQQQMLALAMAFLSKPRLLMIDELSLGLAPIIVAQLLPVIEEFRAAGTTVILVEQSVNVALDVAETAFFLEKGEVRFSGPTAELLERPDVLRSVFLAETAHDAHAHGTTGHHGNGKTMATPAPAARTRGETVREDAGGPDAAMQAIGVSRAFGGISAVDRATLHVGPNEILGIIGPNGAGKTTLFDLLSGFVRPDDGTITLAGHDVTGLDAAGRARRGLGRSFQDARLFPSLTVDEALAVSMERWVKSRGAVAAALHLPNVYDSEMAVRKRVDELIELLGLGAYRSKFVSELSTGTRRIVDLAGLLAHRPSVILLDEPSSGIAQREVEALAPLLERIRTDTGASLVVIEHDMPLLRGVSDRLVAMDQGAVICTGTPDAVLSDPLVVESYLGPDETAVNRSSPALQ
ncbi:MFS transporter [Actinospongicola halichondriae]|uniref:MFS transporter n=1 Tax=Actinospongicola halichondriae TaxID=3236844 RepID=UPI003D589C2A